jgi:twitching motility protein PilI
LPISDLSLLLTEQSLKNHSTQQQKILMVNCPGNYSGFLVEHVSGLQHFNKQSYFSANPLLPAKIAQCTQGYFEHDNRHWHVFMFSRLLQNPEFLNIAI